MSSTDGFDKTRLNTTGGPEPFSPGMGLTFTSGFSNAGTKNKFYNNKL